MDTVLQTEVSLFIFHADHSSQNPCALRTGGAVLPGLDAQFATSVVVLVEVNVPLLKQTRPHLPEAFLVMEAS
jgi:hypothetical protein